MRTFTHSDLKDELTRMIRHDSQKNVAAALGFSPQFINDVISGRRVITDRLAKAMGYYKITHCYGKLAPK